MGIVSLEFLAFIAVVVIIFYIVRPGHQWIVLLGASTVFYLSYSVKGIFFLLGTALFTWFLAVQIQKSKDAEKAWLTENRENVDREAKKIKRNEFHRQQYQYELLAIIITVGLLFLTKYYGSMAEGINLSMGTKLWTAENILLPLGISYYSLQLIGYIIDVSRDIIPAEKNPFKVVLYGMFFLSIMQGPFNRYSDLMPQICKEERPKLSVRQFHFAVLRILGGYIKKMCIADQVGLIANEVFTRPDNYSGLGCVAGVFCFAIQIYADFAGYMDIVIGIGELFGIQIPENFRQPFFSRNMSEFWRRWHITLGLWLKDYVFYPVLKSNAFQKMGKKIKKSLGKEAGRKIPTWLGMLILWTLIGAWHGAGINYVFGVGILQFLYIWIGEMAEPLSSRVKATLRVNEEGLPWHIFQSLRTTGLMMIAWVFFKSETLVDALRFMRNIFLPSLLHLSSYASVFEVNDSVIQWQNPWIWAVYTFLCAVVLMTLDIMKEKGVCIREKLVGQRDLIRFSVYVLMVLALLIFGAYGTQYQVKNFIYFEF